MYTDEFGVDQDQHSAPIHITPEDIAPAAEAVEQGQQPTVDEEAQAPPQAQRSFEEMIKQQKASTGEGYGHGHGQHRDHGHGHGLGHHSPGHHGRGSHTPGHHHGHAHAHGACPPEVADVLFSPERLKFHNPHELMRSYLTAGMTAVDVGCAKGFFTIPMLEMVGQHGRVVAIDFQSKMLEALAHNVSDKQAQRLVLLQCSDDDFRAQSYAGQADFVLMFWMLHEIEDTERAVRQAAALLKPGGTLMLTEPNFRVDQQGFEACVDLFVSEGLEVVERPDIWTSFSAVLRSKRA
jgi:2-polyprenyl-3-methyl-5-hydroxy-6-metoxy-1,4-benzoquinol methylase